MPLVTFFSVLKRPGKNRKGVATTPLVRRGLIVCVIIVSLPSYIRSGTVLVINIFVFVFCFCLQLNHCQ